MIKIKGRLDARRWLLSFAVLALLTMGMVPLLAAGAARADDGSSAVNWKNLALLYTTDVKGKIEPCG